MVDINLLPWREYAHAYRVRHVKKILSCSFLLSIVLTVLLHLLFIQHAHALVRQVEHLEDKTKQMNALSDNQTKPDSFSSQFLTAINQNQRITKKIFIELLQKKITNICFNEIMRRKNNILILGYASSVFALNEVLQSWRKIPLFANIRLEEMEQRKNHSVFFRLQIPVKSGFNFHDI